MNAVNAVQMGKAMCDLLSQKGASIASVASRMACSEKDVRRFLACYDYAERVKRKKTCAAYTGQDQSTSDKSPYVLDRIQLEIAAGVRDFDGELWSTPLPPPPERNAVPRPPRSPRRRGKGEAA